MLFSEVVVAAHLMSATRSRLAKVQVAADLLQALEPDEVPVTVGLLLGKPRQGRIGVGWRTVQPLLSEPASTPSLSVSDVDAAFSSLASSIGTGAGSSAARGRVLSALLGAATADEQDLLVRIITGEVRTGALEGVLLDAVAKASGTDAETVRRAAMLTGDLGSTAALALAGGDLGAVGLVPGVPVMPMLASTAASISDAIAKTGEASVEHKLDGARLQVHRVGGEVTAYTRSLADVTARVPELVRLVETFPGGDLILDGETLTLDEEGGARPFADTMSRFGATAARESQLSVQFFDVLHAEGADLLDAPLRERRVVLERIVPPAALIPGTTTDDPEVAEQVYADAVAAGQEGVLIKSIDAAYAAGRRGASWIKVKPVHTYDLVVLAAEWGYGRRTGLLSNLHLGARDPDGVFGEPGGFVMVGKTFKGLTDATLRWQTEYFPTIATSESRGTVWLEPTTVVEIAIDGVQRSPRYPAALALRFARVKRYRTGDDAKPATDADTIDTLLALLRT